MNTQGPGQATRDGTVGKALDVLDRVASRDCPVRFSDILADSPHPKATLYRLLQTLVNQGMLRYDADRQTYAPGLRLVRLAHSAWKQASLAPLARPHLDALAALVGETVHLAQLDQGQVLYVDKRNARQPVEMFSQAGKVGPGYCTGVGKAMLACLDEDDLDAAINRQSFFAHTPHTLNDAQALRADLDRIRAEGVAYDREEHEPGIICIAAAIRSGDGRLLGAVSITSVLDRHSLDDMAGFRPALLNAAADIAGAAENWQFPA